MLLCSASSTTKSSHRSTGRARTVSRLNSLYYENEDNGITGDVQVHINSFEVNEVPDKHITFLISISRHYIDNDSKFIQDWSISRRYARFKVFHIKYIGIPRNVTD